VTPPSVSVIVPCYRYAGVLEGCVQSVLAQEGVDVHVLVIDDCSPDETPVVAGRLAAADARVEYRRHATNRGLIATANEGLEWATGDYVVLLSADDLLTPGSLLRATTVMTQRPEVGMVYGRTAFAYVDRALPQPGSRWRTTRVWRGADWIRMRCRTGYNCISSPEVVVRTTVQRAVGGYDPSCFHTSDLNMWLRIAAASDVAYLGAVQAIYRIHADSMLRSDASPMVDLRNRRAAFESFFDGGSATELPDPTSLRAAARRALARQALWQASRAIDRGDTDSEGAALIADLVEFALDVSPEARRLREWRGYQLRRRIGAGRSLWFFPFVVTGAAHRAGHHVRMLRLRSRGI
jgi:glycosyltransferase involved in cell wall biosynthesis